MPDTFLVHAGRTLGVTLRMWQTATVLTVLSLSAACSGNSASGNAPTTPSVQNRPPTAGTISVSPTGTGMAGVTSFSFASDGAQDPDGHPLSFAWTFGDGGTGTGATVARTYDSIGSFTVTLSVSDGTVSVTAPDAAVTVAPNLATPAWGADEVNGPNCGFSGFPACRDVPFTPSFPRMVLKLVQNGRTLTGSIRNYRSCNGGPVGVPPIPLTGTVSSLTHPASVQLTTDSFECGRTLFELGRSFALQTNASGTVLSGTAAVMKAPASKEPRAPIPGPITFERCGAGASPRVAFVCSELP